jgi:ATP-dependent DNA helicase RecQ
MQPDALSVLQFHFGYSTFRGLQEEIVTHLVAGGDALVLMPTGGGKSLCYQIPALLRSGTGIVVSPLIALMEDQVTAMTQLGIKAAYLNSSLEFERQKEVEMQLASAVLDLLYVAPERLLTERFLSLLDRCRIALFAIDEAHCVSQWGHNFRADYWQLSKLHERYPEIPRIALTATADSRTRQEIIERLALSKARIFCSSFDRPNIRYTIGLKANPRQQLLDFIGGTHDGHSGIVYCLSRRKVDETTEWLRSKGYRALPYHAGLPAEVRQQNQRRFLREEGLIVVATIAFGMGIDKPNVRFVAHLDLPRSIEAYYQETGRAGRDGLPASAWMVYGLQDIIMLRGMVDASEASEVHKQIERHRLDAMLGFCELTTCRRQALLHYFGEQTDHACGNCDTCLSPVGTWNATEAAQKALSCVYRTGQRYGAHYVVDVLLGKDSERAQTLGHSTLSTFGIGGELTDKQWLSVFRQLLIRGHLQVDMESHGALRLTESARPILRGEQHLMLRRDIEKTERAKRRKSSDLPSQFPDSADEQLWQELRLLRRRLANEQGVPPYLILHDSVLQEMVSQRPTTMAELARLPGIGDRKLERYGANFLEIMETFGTPSAIPTTNHRNSAEESLALFQLGMNVDQIMLRRGLTRSTIFGHLIQAVNQGQADSLEVVGMAKEEAASLEKTWRALPETDTMKLLPLFEAFNGRYDYEVLRCLRAGWLWADRSEVSTAVNPVNSPQN